MPKPSPEEIAAVAQKGYWCVLRHGGRSSDSWRLRVGYENEEEGIVAFRKVRDSMRQGGVTLISQSLSINRHQEAPRLRTRW